MGCTSSSQLNVRPLLSISLQNPVGRGSLSMERQNNQVQKPLEYVRENLATEPVFNTIVGNLPSIVETIEETIYEASYAKPSLSKELVPYCCIVSHGKSLLLDLMLKNDPMVLVIPVTYNNTISFNSREITKPAVALAYFWLRVLKSVIKSPFNLDELYNQHGSQISFAYVKETARHFYAIDPFITLKDGKIVQKNILFCVDEFSIVIDSVQRIGKDGLPIWSKQEQSDFIADLNSVKRHRDPFIQFVLTGFNNRMTSLCRVSTKVLSLCPSESAKPLLKKIVKHYQDANKEVPQLLLESVKSTPGLIGLWAEQVVSKKREWENLRKAALDKINRSEQSEHRKEFSRQKLLRKLKVDYPSSVEGFCKDLPWIVKVKESSTEWWMLVLNYLIALETEDETMLYFYGEQLIENEIGIGSSTFPQISPLCFVVLVKSMIVKLSEVRDDIQLQLLDCFAKILKACSEANPESAKKYGAPFESFVLQSFFARLLIRKMLPLPHVCSFSKLFSVQRTVKLTGKSIEHSVFIHGIWSSQNLKKFLLSPLYYLFPLGLKQVEVSTINKNVEFVSAWFEKIEATDYDCSMNINGTLFGKRLVLMSKVGVENENNENFTNCITGLFCDLRKQSKLFENVEEFQRYNESYLNEKISDEEKEWVVELCYGISLMLDFIKSECGVAKSADSDCGGDIIIKWHDDPVLNIGSIELIDRSHLEQGMLDKSTSRILGPNSILAWLPFVTAAELSCHYFVAGREHADLGPPFDPVENELLLPTAQ